jgi:hypothetical protein
MNSLISSTSLNSSPEKWTLLPVSAIDSTKQTGRSAQLTDQTTHQFLAYSLFPLRPYDFYLPPTYEEISHAKAPSRKEAKLQRPDFTSLRLWRDTPHFTDKKTRGFFNFFDFFEFFTHKLGNLARLRYRLNKNRRAGVPSLRTKPRINFWHTLCSLCALTTFTSRLQQKRFLTQRRKEVTLQPPGFLTLRLGALARDLPQLTAKQNSRLL